MGTYRFVLALLVALSHMGVTVFGGRNLGVVAVISFFLISGFVMTGLVRTHYGQLSDLPLFYLDRAARIFPQYLLFAALALAGKWVVRFESPYLTHPSLWGGLANLTVIPLDFFMYSNTIASFMLLPQAWSLGLELTFYLSIPLVLIWGWRTPLCMLSMAIWLLAAFQVVNTDAWGYRMLPGTLFVFLLGSYVYDQRRMSWYHPAVTVLWVLMAVGVLLWTSHWLAVPYTFEVLLGLLLGVPSLFVLARLPHRSWDDRLGNLSYGLFLSHFLVLWATERAGMSTTKPVFQAGMLVASTVLAYLGYMAVERPVLQWRRRFRRLVSETPK